MAEQVILEIVPQVVGEEAIENEIKGVGEAAQQAFKKANTENAKYIEPIHYVTVVGVRIVKHVVSNLLTHFRIPDTRARLIPSKDRKVK